MCIRTPPFTTTERQWHHHPHWIWGACNVCIWLRFQMLQFSLRSLVPLVAEAVVAQKQGHPKEDPAKIVGRSDCFGSHIRTVYLATVGHWFQPSLTAGWCQCWFSSWCVAASYLRIRAVALPASLVNTVAIGAFRGHLDTSTPLYVILLQTLADVISGWKKLCVFFNSCFHLTLMLGSCQVEGKKAKTLRTLLIFRF